MTRPIKRIAVFTSGGDAPGMNAAVRSVVRTATYHDLHIYGINRGYEGMIEGDIRRLETNDVGNIIHRGGTILKTARSEKFRKKLGRKLAFENLMAHDIDALVAIGGNGTFTGANIFGKNSPFPSSVFPAQSIMTYTVQIILLDLIPLSILPSKQWIEFEIPPTLTIAFSSSK